MAPGRYSASSTAAIVTRREAAILTAKLASVSKVVGVMVAVVVGPEVVEVVAADVVVVVVAVVEVVGVVVVEVVVVVVGVVVVRVVVVIVDVVGAVVVLTGTRGIPLQSTSVTLVVVAEKHPPELNTSHTLEPETVLSHDIIVMPNVLGTWKRVPLNRMFSTILMSPNTLYA